MPRSAPKSPAQTAHNERVSASWLLKAIGAVLVVAMGCTYFTLCFLYYQGQWQIVLHPGGKASQATLADLVRFGPDESGKPQLVGQRLAAPAGGRYSGLTVLILSSGDGSAADSATTIASLHDLGINVFSFDYRGYGLSNGAHPNQQRMTEDVEAAWRYLTSTGAVPAAQVVPYGMGVGASLATHLAEQHAEIPALILDSPYTDLLATARRNSPSFLPVGLLFREHFPMRETLADLHTPKLLIADTNSQPPAAFVTAANPKITVSLRSHTGSQYQETITRFLDQYLQPLPIPALSKTN